MNHKNQLKHDSIVAFTLIELIVVIAILAMLAAGIVPSITTRIKRENIEDTKTEIEELAQALKEYYKDTDQFPSSSTNPLRDLENNPGVSGWDGPYITKKFEDYDYEEDEWGNDYDYSYPGGEWGQDPCTFYSYGPDREDDGGSGDDISHTVDPKQVMKEKRDRIRQELEVIKKQAQQYYDDNGNYPDDIEDLYTGGGDYLEDESYREDEWSQEYEPIDTNGDGDEDQFISKGPDTLLGTADDVYPY